MECIFFENLNQNDLSIAISPAESKHLKALHINSNDKILVINGKGLSATAIINRISKNDFIAEIVEFSSNMGELNFNIGLAFGILDNKDRFEFAIEKCIELGVLEIFPLVLDYSEQKNINIDRLTAKSIAAIKQCKRSAIPTIHTPSTIENIFKRDIGHYNNIVLADECGISPTSTAFLTALTSTESRSSLVFIGAEGGFSDRELSLFPINTIKINLGNRRLRAETAAITAVGLISLI